MLAGQLFRLRAVLFAVCKIHISAGFACVYKVREHHTSYALKCFIRPLDKRREYYQHICHFLSQQKSPYLLAPQYLSESLYVASTAAGNG